MHKNKPHKGLLKRVRVTKSGFVRHNRAGYKHLRSTKSPNRLRRLRAGSVASDPDAKRLSRLLYRRLRGRTQPRSALRRSPSPAERKAMREAASKAAATASAPRPAPRKTKTARA